MSEALKYEDLAELGDGTQVYCINYNDNMTGILTIRDEGSKFVLEPYDDEGTFTGHTIPFMENTFYRTPEDALRSVFAKIEQLITDELSEIEKLKTELNYKIGKVTDLFHTYLNIKALADSDIE